MLERPARRYKWLLFLMVVVPSGATATTYLLLEYPALKAAGFDPSPFMGWAFLLLVISAPLIWLGALVVPAIEWIVILRAHAALFTTVAAIDEFAASPGHGSPGEALADAFPWVIWSFIFLFLGVDLLAAEVTRVRLKRWSLEAEAPPLIYAGLAAALLGGWFAGVLIWSAMLPPRVIAAAETAAGDRPYCIDLEKGPALAARNLRGLSMRASSDHGWTWSFHALLVVGDAANRSYMNWSYRTGHFEPVSDHAREGLHLDKIVRCTPVAHFARGLL
jgi:hypothetical protein